MVLGEHSALGSHVAAWLKGVKRKVEWRLRFPFFPYLNERGSSQETMHEEENSNKMASSFQFIPFAHEMGMSQETMHNTVRQAELVNPICVTQHPDN